MIEVTLKEIDRGWITLKRLADNAKLPPPLFIRIRNTWRDAQEHMESVGIKQQESIDSHFEIVTDPAGKKSTQPKSQEDRIAHDATIRSLLGQTVQMIRVMEKIPWKWIEDAKIEPPLTPAECVVLAWLIDLPEETEVKNA